VSNLSSPQREAKIARGTEDGVERMQAGDRQLPALSIKDDSVRRFIALVDECYDRRVPLYIEAQVPLAELYCEGYLSFAFRRTLSRLQEMQLERFGAGNQAAPAP
ncbi:AFG1/ZapE family ATPase, partial [Pseudomonas sp.]|uniref:AFG1/ZapE family ATPase n=1 Tax=Pseudomonas sp. TaxID=306 RepID=UPI002737264B